MIYERGLMNILDLVGEDNIWVALESFDVYDLWSGNWHYKKSSI